MLADTIKEIRKQHYLNQAAFAKMIGVTQSAVSQWENDLTRPNSYQLEAIAKVFNISIDELLADNIAENTSESPRTSEAKIISEGIDRMPQKDREKALSILKTVYSEYFDQAEEKNA